VARKAKITTFITFGVWAVLCGVILSGVISIHDIDFRGVMDAPSAP
jgi:hypothetical protein